MTGTADSGTLPVVLETGAPGAVVVKPEVELDPAVVSKPAVASELTCFFSAAMR